MGGGFKRVEGCQAPGSQLQSNAEGRLNMAYLGRLNCPMHLLCPSKQIFHQIEGTMDDAPSVFEEDVLGFSIPQLRPSRNTINESQNGAISKYSNYESILEDTSQLFKIFLNDFRKPPMGG